MVSDGPPAGWNAMDGALRPGVRGADYAARGQATFASCANDGCKRSVKLDPREMARQGTAGWRAAGEKMFEDRARWERV